MDRCQACGEKPEWLDVLLDLDGLQEATVTRGSHSYTLRTEAAPPHHRGPGPGQAPTAPPKNPPRTPQASCHTFSTISPHHQRCGAIGGA